MVIPRLLVYAWNVADAGFVGALKNIGIPYVIYDRPMRDYHADGEFAQDVVSLVIRERIDAIFSYDFFHCCHS